MKENEQYGILTKEFIKKQIQKENELESKISELEDTITSLKKSLKIYESCDGTYKLNDNNLSKAFNILLHILRYSSINMNSYDLTPLWGTSSDSPPKHIPRSYSLSINELQLSEDEASFIINLVNEDHQRSLNIFNNEFDSHWHENGRGSNSRWSSNYHNATLA